MEKAASGDFRGVAGLFTKDEIKRYFIIYLIVIGILEVFILLVTFLGNLGPDKGPFPWESYCLAAFLVPLAITFFIGTFVYAFNKYLFEKPAFRDDTAPSGGDLGKEFTSSSQVRLQSVVNSMRQLPFLFMLLALAGGAVFVFKLDTIVYYVGQLGGTAAKYAIIFILIVLALAAVVSVVWLYINYNLRKKSMKYHYEYKKEVMERVGLVLLDDNTVLDEKGKVVNSGNSARLPLDRISTRDVSFLPAPKEDVKKQTDASPSAEES